MSKAYKLFRQKDGKLYPLFVLATKETPIHRGIFCLTIILGMKIFIDF